MRTILNTMVRWNHSAKHAVLRVSLVAAIAALGLRADAITVTTSPDLGFFPSSAEIITQAPDDGFHQPAFGSPFTISQTFQVPTAFDLQNVYMVYQNNSGSAINVGMEIFTVTNVFAEPIDSPGSTLLSTSFSAPIGGSNTIMALTLDSLLNLPATTGNEGYALRYTSPGADLFKWKRTGASLGNTYADGVAYVSGAGSNGGLRDYMLALSKDPLPALPDVFSVASGDLNAGTTWDDGLVPSSGNQYNIVSPHVVTSTSSSFAGGKLVVASGGELDLTTDFLTFPTVEISAGGTLTGSATGDFALGDINAATLSFMQLDGTANIAATAGADFFVDVDLSGSGDLNFQGNSAGSDMVLSAASNFGGVIRFNGSGDEVKLLENERFGNLEMNSTDANRLVYDPSVNILIGGRLIYNQAGSVDHASATNTLFGPADLVVNAPLTVDLTKTLAGGRRRFFIADNLEGSADITVNGTASAPASGIDNEFEVESTDESPEDVLLSSYSGTITANDYTALEMRQEFPAARFVINQNATLEMGFRQVDTLFELRMGEIQVNNGGTLNVGYEEDDEHVPQGLRLTSAEGQSGDLTLANGSTTVLQVSGIGANEFDRIVVEGDIVLDGTLKILVDPLVPSNANAVPGYTSPTLGDTFDIIELVPSSPAADFDGNGTVAGADLAEWEGAFGVDGSADADGDGDSDGADFLAWQRTLGNSGVLGTLTGAFDVLDVDDPFGVLSGSNLMFQLNVTATLVQLEVVAASPVSAVPEPSTGLLAIGLAMGITSCRRCRR